MRQRSKREFQRSRREMRQKVERRPKKQRGRKREKELKSPLRKLVNSNEGEDGDVINLP
jgi:hypothetical protein